MDFDTFARRAEEILREIPEEFLHGVLGVEVHRRVERHPHLPGIHTLGVCASEDVRLMADPGDTSSRVHLYHGSFVEAARLDPTFDFEHELRETILHEIRHHLEDRAGLPDLRREDDLFEALARFRAGEDLPEGWYRYGRPFEEDAWAVLDDLFLELRLRREELESMRGRVVEVIVDGEPLEVEMPDDLEAGEVLSYPGEGLESDRGVLGDLHLVVRVRG
jgi:hypothetical protein